MAFEVVMPRLGWTMEVGRFIEWLKLDGEEVEAGEILFTAEGDKAIQEVEALESGILRIRPDAPPPGDEVPVGTVLAYLVKPGEPAPFGSVATVSLATPATQATASAQRVAAPAVGAGRGAASAPAASPRARRVAAELGIDWRVLAGSGRTGRVVERDVRRAAQARAQQVEVGRTTLGQSVVGAPGEQALRVPSQPAVASQESPTPWLTPAAAPGEVIPPSRLRQVIARRMAQSAHTTAPVTLTTETDATELVMVRERLQAAQDASRLIVPTYTDLIIKLTAFALQEHSLLNATLQDDKIVVAASVHIAVAVDTEAGLLVPVIRDVPTKTIGQIAAESQSLAERARARQLREDEVQGGTFTITNLGSYGIDAFTPIINLPQCAILGVGRIISRPAVVHDQILARKMMTLSLTFDHRIVDGGPAARFLNTVREYVEQPYRWLLR